MTTFPVRTVGLETPRRHATIEARVQPFEGGLLLSAPLHSPAQKVLLDFSCEGSGARIIFAEGAGPFTFWGLHFYPEGEEKRVGLSVRPQCSCIARQRTEWVEWTDRIRAAIVARGGVIAP